MSLRGARRIWPHFWFKTAGSSAFMTAFFMAYIDLLKHPRRPVTEMPWTVVDDWVGFHPWTVAIYVSLWVYVSLPVALMVTRTDILRFGWRMGALCLTGLVCFACWPTAVPDPHIDWAAYPGMAVLKGVDAAGNACPSLHVATTVLAGLWLHAMASQVGGGRVWRWACAAWGVAILYSTLATRQHVFIDVCCGVLLGAALAWLTWPRQLVQA